MKGRGLRRGRHRIPATLRRSLALLAFCCALAVAQPASATHPVEGWFVAGAECPAFQSFRRQTNPGGVALRLDERYRVLALNRPGGEQALVVVPQAQPERRWVALACGRLEIENGAERSAARHDFRPFFDMRDDGPRDATPPPPNLGPLDHAVLEICGEWGSRPSRAAFRRLFDAPELARETNAVYEELGGSVRGAPLAPELFADELTALWFAEEGFRHVFCGEPGEGRLGGLHFKGRFLQMQERGWGGFAPCRAQEIDPPIKTIGVEFLDRSGRVALACPKSYSTRLDARGILVEATRAFAAREARGAGEAMCLHEVARPEGRRHDAVLVARAGAIRTFYPHASPACEGGRPAQACRCGG